MSLTTLAGRAAAFGTPLDTAQLAAFELYRDELLDWNGRVNLTAVTDPDEIELRHFVDSLTCLPLLTDLSTDRRPRMLDVGAGAGFPGLPLKLARPEVELTLLDSVGKKTAFLAHLVERLRLTGVIVITGRAEDLARTPTHRESYDAVLARALAPLPVLLELCLPFARLGGRLVAHRRGDLAAQQREAHYAAGLLGGRFRDPVLSDIGTGPGEYGLVIVDKVAPTPAAYPRRVGLPAKRPLTGA